MREAAAHQARAAAAEAVASDVARATAHSNDSTPRKLNVVRMQPRRPRRSCRPERSSAQSKSSAETLAKEESPSAPSSDYYSLFQPAEPPGRGAAGRGIRVAGVQHRLQAPREMGAACRRVPASCYRHRHRYGSQHRHETVTDLVTPDEKPELVVERVNPDPFIEVVEQRVGSLKVESTPEGAEAIVDGRSYGKTPLTIPDLEVGTHTLVLKSTRRHDHAAGDDQEQPDDAAVGSDLLGLARHFLADSSRPLSIDGKPVNLTDDGRLMTDAGKARGRVRERAVQLSRDGNARRPAGRDDSAYGEPADGKRPRHRSRGRRDQDRRCAGRRRANRRAPVAIGSHEISATHPSLGERRASVDVRQGDPTEVTLQFE